MSIPSGYGRQSARNNRSDYQYSSSRGGRDYDNGIPRGGLRSRTVAPSTSRYSSSNRREYNDNGIPRGGLHSRVSAVSSRRYSSSSSSSDDGPRDRYDNGIPRGGLRSRVSTASSRGYSRSSPSSDYGRGNSDNGIPIGGLRSRTVTPSSSHYSASNDRRYNDSGIPTGGLSSVYERSRNPSNYPSSSSITKPANDITKTAGKQMSKLKAGFREKSASTSSSHSPTISSNTKSKRGITKRIGRLMTRLKSAIFGGSAKNKSSSSPDDGPRDPYDNGIPIGGLHSTSVKNDSSSSSDDERDPYDNGIPSGGLRSTIVKHDSSSSSDDESDSYDNGIPRGGLRSTVAKSAKHNARSSSEDSSYSSKSSYSSTSSDDESDSCSSRSSYSNTSSDESDSCSSRSSYSSTSSDDESDSCSSRSSYSSPSAARLHESSFRKSNNATNQISKPKFIAKRLESTISGNSNPGSSLNKIVKTIDQPLRQKFVEEGKSTTGTAYSTTSYVSGSVEVKTASSTPPLSSSQPGVSEVNTSFSPSELHSKCIEALNLVNEGIMQASQLPENPYLPYYIRSLHSFSDALRLLLDSPSENLNQWVNKKGFFTPFICAQLGADTKGFQSWIDWGSPSLSKSQIEKLGRDTMRIYKSLGQDFKVPEIPDLMRDKTKAERDAEREAEKQAREAKMQANFNELNERLRQKNVTIEYDTPYVPYVPPEIVYHPNQAPAPTDGKPKLSSWACY